ncbi:leucine-rich repeat-containing protein (LRR) [Tieghemostelium lacteum]|uniref:Leucine-rich repeat-containing protein (LRR) n=1 Tax=Tieghemostelium lacteum TaxID=361077 RepID=A0A152A303_TIELA|nr:leucine-rich repeat-containing protein (LRR) [Tieghemostelium lacteum]|eukprot:KYR00584.1 leucine-rich repeat-containing protein (LRR) [Tieghemostelium lacteum]
MKLTPETLSSKLGKKVDINTVDELSLESMGFSDCASFARLKNLKKLDLKGNRFQLIRHIKGFFDLPAITDLNLTGNPVTKQSGYRLTVLHYIPTLLILDGEEVSTKEREQARTFDPNNIPKGTDPLSRLANQDESDEEEVQPVVKSPPKPVEQVKPVVVEQPKPVLKPVEQVKPVVVEQPKPVPKPVEQVKPQPAVEKPSNDLPKEEIKPMEVKTSKPQQPKKDLLDEDSLFGNTNKGKKKLEFEDDGEDLSFDSINISELEKKPTKKKESKLVFADDDNDDDIFKSSSKKPTSNTKSKTFTENDGIDDDLFGGPSNSSESKLNSDFDLDSYISSQKSRTKGGLFD